VDDLESVRVMLRRQLTSLGHTVLEACDGLQALEVVRDRRGELDLVLSDVVMPSMNGTEVAACLCTEYPGLPVVLMSAYAPAGLTRVGFQDAVVPVLQKPFELGQLAELIQVAVELPAAAAAGAKRNGR
jgi:two-component system cell cycle sensor histidine kinase/response regulator CckA